jgi:hypothetical protein
MNAADWATLENLYYPPPVESAPAPAPEVGTYEHYVAAGGSPRGGTGSAGYARYRQAMATIYGDRVQGEFLGGEGGLYDVGGQQFNSPYVFDYQGNYYEPHRGALNWASDLAQQYGVGPGEAETMFGPSPNPDIFGTIAAQLAEWGVPARFLEVTHPAFEGYGGPGMSGGYSDFDAERGPAQGFGFEGGDPAHDE